MPALFENRVAYYKCDESSGNLVDAQGSNTWTDVNTVAGGVAGKINTCRDLELSNSECFTSNSTDFLFTASDMSISLWVKLEQMPGTGELYTVAARGYDASDITSWWLTFSNPSGSPQLVFFRYAAGVSAGATWTISGTDFTDGFHHIVATRSGTTWKVWVDGVEKASGTGSLVTDSDTLTAIGAQVVLGTPDRFFDGKMDEIGFWDRALDSADIAALYNSGNGLAYAARTASTYYFATSGNDSNAGTIGSPFQTISRANSLKMMGGDSFLFNKGDTFSGTLTLALATGAATPTALAPLTVGPYGTGTAPIISCGNNDGISGHDLLYLTISGLHVSGSGVTLVPGLPNTITSTATGVGIYCRNTGGSDIAGLVINACEIEGVSTGLAMGHALTPQTKGYTAPQITNNTIHDCISSGIRVTNASDFTVSIHHNVAISGNAIYNVFGDGVNNTGYGIIAFACTDSIIELNFIHDNGAASDPLASTGGPCGIIAAGTQDCIIRNNVIARQGTNGSNVDGQGIDSEQASDGLLIHGNYITDCEGEGITMLSIGGTVDNVTIRFNVVEKCKSMFRHSGATNIICHNNTGYQTGSGNLIIEQSASTGIKYYNNVFITGAGASLGVVLANTFNGNLYDCSTFSLSYNSHSRASLAAFRSGDSQETGTGFQTAAGLLDAGNGPANPATANEVTAYNPAAGSAVLGTGLDISGLYSVDPGTLDYHGLTNQPGGDFSIGAVASGVGFTLSPSTIPSNHSGEIELVATGIGTTWLDDNEDFAVTGKTRQTIRSNTDASIFVTTTGATTLTISETVGSNSANVTVATATISVTPTSALLNTTPTLTITTTNMVLTQETAATLLSISGGSGASLGTPTINDDNSATVVLAGGAGTGTLTITLNPVSGGVSDTVAVGAATRFYATPSPTTHAAINIAKTFHVYANGLSTATITGHVNADGTFAGAVALNNTTPVALSLTMTAFASSPYSVTFTDSGSLTDPSAISLITTEFPQNDNRMRTLLRP